MKIYLAILITSTLFISSSVSAAAGWNLDVFVGKQQSDNLVWNNVGYPTDSGESYGIGISKQVSPRLGLGFEVGYTKNEYSAFKPNYISGLSTMATVEYDFVQNGRFSAYSGFGLGMIKVKYSSTGNYTNSDNVIGGRVSLGARYAVSRKSKLFLEARHIESFKDPKIAGATSSADAEYKGDSVMLGFRYTF